MSKPRNQPVIPSIERSPAGANKILNHIISPENSEAFIRSFIGINNRKEQKDFLRKLPDWEFERLVSYFNASKLQVRKPKGDPGPRPTLGITEAEIPQLFQEEKTFREGLKAAAKRAPENVNPLTGSDFDAASKMVKALNDLLSSLKTKAKVEAVESLQSHVDSIMVRKTKSLFRHDLVVLEARIQTVIEEAKKNKILKGSDKSVWETELTAFLNKHPILKSAQVEKAAEKFPKEQQAPSAKPLPHQNITKEHIEQLTKRTGFLVQKPGGPQQKPSAPPMRTPPNKFKIR